MKSIIMEYDGNWSFQGLSIRIHGSKGLEEFQFQDLRVGADKGYPNDLGTALAVLFNFS